MVLNCSQSTRQLSSNRLHSEGEARPRVALGAEPKMASSMMQPRATAVAVHSHELMARWRGLNLHDLQGSYNDCFSTSEYPAAF